MTGFLVEALSGMKTGSSGKTATDLGAFSNNFHSFFLVHSTKISPQSIIYVAASVAFTLVGEILISM